MLLVGDFENADDAYAEAKIKAKGREWKEGTFKMHFENVEDEDEEMILKLN
jgi:hypothetical protein